MWEGYTSDSTTDDDATADDGSEVDAEKCDPDWESTPTSADTRRVADVWKNQPHTCPDE